MKKDIEIPKVEKVHVAAVREFNKEFQADEWNAYIINNKNVSIEMILIVAKGYDGKKETSVMRHKLEKLPPHSFAKIEFIQDEVLGLNNEYQVTFFAENKMFEKAFVFKKNSVNEANKKELPIIPKLGILAE
ncbi:hypothetical protein INR75_03545 [Zunongwangia sp. SCSIO 43204]|uniref:Phenylalanyl-tRNA synthetase subunit alpha n=1 Tax=Zunongwangia mangrovi TaxID=1334022 RepID=A0A1I1DET2_9FLAO|nr:MULTISPECIES: hypothetical protein [Zunongwangia]UAB85112.1 hypothetical protein INR75_03545 [Zunongwangia sp. SCSIO 43204]SFB73421.1 hypothetical protein SAMN04487907_101324 [Zunongwangia mangrovi]